VLCKVKVNVRPLATLDIFCCRAHEQVAMYWWWGKTKQNKN
jgi:hypothetical protein